MSYFNRMKTVTYSRDASKVLRRMPKMEAVRIMAKVDQYAAEPAALANNVKRLVGRDDVLRLRVGV